MRIMQTRSILVERFPLAFMPRGAPKIPLKVGIFNDLIGRCPDIHRRALKSAMWDYCRGPKYLAGLLYKADRIDLDGCMAGSVTDKEAEQAAKLLHCMLNGLQYAA